MNRPWIFDWIEENSIDSIEKAGRVFEDRNLFNKLRLAASQIGPTKLGEEPSPTGIGLLAGRGIDLTGDLDCTSPECLTRQVETLLRHVWHYFDFIFVDDLTQVISRTPYHKVYKRYATAWLGVMAYLYNVGAADMVYLVDKENNCDSCIEEKARSVGLGTLIDIRSDLSNEVAERSKLLVFPDRQKQFVKVYLDLPDQQGAFSERREVTWLKSKGEDGAKSELASDYVNSVLRGLTSDVRSARLAHASMGATVKYYEELIARALVPDELQPDSVAFNLDLPILDGVPLRAIFELKHAEGDMFLSFQSSLRVAIREKARTLGLSDARRVAREIEADIIDPEIARIRTTLARNSQSLRRNFGTAALGGAMITAGLLLNQPAALSAGAITSGSGLTNALRTLQDRDNLAATDMYFLFKAMTHAEEHDVVDDRFRFAKDSH